MPSLKQFAQSISNHMPGGILFSAKNLVDSNLYNLILGSAVEFKKAYRYLFDFVDNTIPDRTVLLLEEWEKAVGIPDDCFPATGTTAERSNHVLVKLAALGVQTEQDFIDLADVFGISVSVSNGADDVAPGAPNLTDMFTLIITLNSGGPTFPFTFPIPFGNDTQAIITCLFTNLKPANCRVIYR